LHLNSPSVASSAFVGVVILGVAVMGVVNEVMPTPAGTGQPPASPSPCALPYPSTMTNSTSLSNGTVVTTSLFPVLDAKPSSRVELCVDYSGSYSGPAPSSVSVGPLGRLTPDQNVSITASPAYISVSKGQTVGVEYIITTGAESRGFYGLSLLQTCAPIPFAVDYAPSELDLGDFPWVSESIMCPFALTLDSEMVGYTNASIGYISTNSKFNPTINITQVSVSSVPSGFGDNITFSMHLQTFTHAVTVELSQDQSRIRAFTTNPDLVTLPVNDDCSWYPSNTNAVNQMTLTSFQDEPWYFMRTNAPVVQMAPFSSANYRVSFLIMGPLAEYTAIDPTLSVYVGGFQQGLYSIAAYFPVSIAGQLQSVSGGCEGSSSG
jgi:hypothetical protein